MMLLRIGSNDMQLVKMVGAFLIVISVLMLVRSGAVMFDSWQSLKGFNNCVEFSGVKDLDLLQGSPDYLLAQMRYEDCKDSLYDITGAQVAGGETALTSRQFWTAILGPVAQFFWWAIVFLFALFLFNNSSIVVPVEEVEVPVRSFGRKRK